MDTDTRLAWCGLAVEPLRPLAQDALAVRGDRGEVGIDQAFGELGRHGITVSTHVTDLPPGKQQAATKGQGAGDQENNGQGFGHGRRQKL